MDAPGLDDSGELPLFTQHGSFLDQIADNFPIATVRPSYTYNDITANLSTLPPPNSPSKVTLAQYGSDVALPALDNYAQIPRATNYDFTFDDYFIGHSPQQGAMHVDSEAQRPSFGQMLRTEGSHAPLQVSHLWQQPATFDQSVYSQMAQTTSLTSREVVTPSASLMDMALWQSSVPGSSTRINLGDRDFWNTPTTLYSTVHRCRPTGTYFSILKAFPDTEVEVFKAHFLWQSTSQYGIFAQQHASAGYQTDRPTVDRLRTTRQSLQYGAKGEVLERQQHMTSPSRASISVTSTSPKLSTSKVRSKRTRSVSQPHVSKWSSHHNTFDAAAAYITSQEMIGLRKIQEEFDDWHIVEGPHRDQWGTDILTALHTEPVGPPPKWTQQEQRYYIAHQDIVMQDVHNKLQDSEMEKSVEARIMLAIGEVVKVHRHGIPEVLFDKNHKGGYAIEMGMVCSTRLRKVLTAVKENAYVKQSLLLGDSIAALAQSPLNFQRRKLANTKNNAHKAIKKAQKVDGAKEEAEGEEGRGLTPEGDPVELSNVTAQEDQERRSASRSITALTEPAATNARTFTVQRASLLSHETSGKRKAEDDGQGTNNGIVFSSRRTSKRVKKQSLG